MIKPVSPRKKPSIVPTIIMFVLAIIILASAFFFFSKLRIMHQSMEEIPAPERPLAPPEPVANPEPAAR